MPSAHYMIFARKEYPQPLEQIGKLMIERGALAGDAPTAELARRAREQFGDEGWVEMVALPETAILRVIPMP